MPIGWLFTILGALLATFGVISDRSIYAQSVGMNINLYWGVILLLFGLLMLGLSRRSNAAARSKTRAD
jgi:sulfite exporter TauE/SafE